MAEDVKKDDKKDDGAIHSSSKSPEDLKAQNDPKTPNPGPVKLDHGEVSDEAKAEADAAKKTAKDPWGSTPAQMRDQHDELVDPEKVGTISTGLVADQLRGTTRLDPMEPQSDEAVAEEHGVKGGTNAPA